MDMTMPKRIQRKRTKGWRMPEGSIYVGRPTMWGNPYRVVDGNRESAIACYRKEIAWALSGVNCSALWTARVKAGLTDLRGKDLACWCRLDQLCHADVLLELANK